MSRSFLTPEQAAIATEILLPPSPPPDGDSAKAETFASKAFSDWLLDGLLRVWQADPDFEASGAVLVGSGARRELCPRSDLDLLFTGPEEAVRGFVGRCQRAGLRIRARTPAELADWGAGVEAFDQLALFDARALTESSRAMLQDQQTLLRRRIFRDRRAWLRTILSERAERESRHDSIANYLEPNLKYGPGGLRDLDQARQLVRLYADRFEGREAAHALEIFDYYARFWTLLRQKCHLTGHGDVFVSAAQFDLARWFGMEHKSLMQQVQRGLSRVHFYSTWITERARVPKAKARAIDRKKIDTRAAALKALESDPSVLCQERVRRDLDTLFPWRWTERSGKERGTLLARVLRPGASEEFIVAVFGSRLMDRLSPELFPLVGHVQHDQYHRYTADIHLQQACREFQRLLRKPARLGVLAREVRELTAFDRRVLGLSVLYHDLMKGRAGDHSTLGRDLVRKDFRRFGWPKAVADEVAWIVEHHLALSTAAFRKNPHAPSTWSSLRSIGAEGARLRRLAVFTVIDICATNPEAWTPWKGRLLRDLLRVLRAPSTDSYFKLEKALAKENLGELAPAIDPALTIAVPAKWLAEDLAEARQGALAPRVVKGRDGTWIRFHEPVDRPGLFAEWARQLYSLGLGIRNATVQTLPGIGAYDLFQVTTKRSPAQLKTWLAAGVAPKDLPAVQFEKISLVSEDADEWVFSFKGLDQPGCLAAAALALAQDGVSLRSARVHTWGRQVDDLFHVTPHGSATELLARMRAHFRAATSVD